MKIFTYIAGVFSSDACASFSRWATAVTTTVGCWALVHLVLVNRALPDAIALGALATWMTAPYGINKLAAAFTKPTTA